MLKSLLLNIIGGIIGTVVLLGIFYIIGLLIHFMEICPIFAIMVGIFDLVWIFREASK